MKFFPQPLTRQSKLMIYLSMLHISPLSSLYNHTQPLRAQPPKPTAHLHQQSIPFLSLLQLWTIESLRCNITIHTTLLVLTKQTDLINVNSDTPSVHKLIRDHVNACYHRNSSVINNTFIRYYSEFFKSFVNELVDPRLNDAKQNLKERNDTVHDI